MAPSGVEKNADAGLAERDASRDPAASQVHRHELAGLVLVALLADIPRADHREPIAGGAQHRGGLESGPEVDARTRRERSGIENRG